jgi:hypothetical protein
MTAHVFRCISRLLIISVFLLPVQPIQAAMVGTGQLISAQQEQGERDKIRTFIGRAEVASQLQALGVNPETAKQRVDALTDEEVQRIAGNLDALPAGGFWGELLLLALVAWLIYIFVVK